MLYKNIYMLYMRERGVYWKTHKTHWQNVYMQAGPLYKYGFSIST